jgi:hypothetical protein
VTRRILLMLLGFTAIVLVGAVVPLTLNATSHDRNSFIQAAAGTARTDAVVAQDYLSLLAEPTHTRASASASAQGKISLLTVAKETRQAGDGLLVLTSRNRAGHYQVVGNPVGVPAFNWDQLADQAHQQTEAAVVTAQLVQPVTEIVGSHVIAAMPVYDGSGPSAIWVGTVILARSTCRRHCNHGCERQLFVRCSDSRPLRHP